MPIATFPKARNRRRARLATALLAIAAICGCTRALRFGPEGEITDPAVLIERLDAQASTRRTLQSEAKVRIRSPDQSGSVEALVAARLPASIRLGLLNFFGKPVADMLALPDRFQLHEVERQIVYVGEPTAENLARVLIVPISPSDAVHFLLGLAPRIAADRQSLGLDRERGAYRLDLSSEESGTRQAIFVDTRTLRPVRVELRGRDRGYDLDFGDFQRIEGVDLPFRLHLTALDGAGRPLGVELSVQQREVALNESLPPRTFEPRLPNEARVIELGPAAPPRLELPVRPEEARRDTGVP